MKGPNGREIETRSRWDQTAQDFTRERISFGAIDGELLASTVQLLTDDGDAVTFGITSDGGAYMVAVLSNGKVSKSYFDSSESLEMRLRSLGNVP